MSALRSQFATKMQKRKYACITADSEHCFDLVGIISAVGVTDIYLWHCVHCLQLCIDIFAFALVMQIVTFALILITFSGLCAET